MPRTDVLERIEIIDQMLQATWSSYEDIIHGIDIRRDEKVTERTIQNYFKRIKTGEGLPQTAYEGLIYNAQDDEYDIIDEMRSGNTKLFKYKNNDFKLFRNKLGARITENLIPFLEYLKELHGLDNNFEEIVDTLEELVEREGFTLVKNHSNVIRLDTKLTYNLNNVQATNDFLPICRNAIVNKRAMKIIYQAKFNKTNELIVHPYKIVEYNNRWMFIAYLESITEKSSIFHDENRITKINNFPFDRILKMESLQEYTFIKTETPIDDLLDKTIGTSIIWEDYKVENVELELNDVLMPYFITKPLHTHQEIDGNIFSYNLIITRELENIILSYGSSIKVLKPESLKQKIINKINEMREIY